MLEQQEYKSEGIDISHINFKDNKNILVIIIFILFYNVVILHGKHFENSDYTIVNVLMLLGVLLS